MRKAEAHGSETGEASHGRQKMAVNAQDLEDAEMEETENAEQGDQATDEGFETVRRKGRKKRPQHNVSERSKNLDGHAGESSKAQDRTKQGNESRSLPKELQCFGQSIGEVHTALQAVAAAIEKDRIAKRTGACAKMGTVVADALRRVEALVGGAALGKLAQVAAQTERIEHQKVQHPSPQTGDKGGRKTWAEVARGPNQKRGTPSFTGSGPEIPWSNSRTVFLRPNDEQWRTRQVSRIQFGDCVQDVLIKAGFGESSLERIARTPMGDWKLQVSGVALPKIREGQFDLGKFGTWKVQCPRVLFAASCVIQGVPLELSDERIKAAILGGASRELSGEKLKALEAIEVRRMATKRRTGVTHATTVSQAATGEGARMPAQQNWSRAVRIFAPREVCNFFTSRGFIMLHFSIHSVRPFAPAQFYCRHCKCMGAHSSKFHRFSNDEERSRSCPDEGTSAQ